MSETKQHIDRWTVERRITDWRDSTGVLDAPADQFADAANIESLGYWEERPPTWGQQRAWTDEPVEDLLHGDEAVALSPLSRKAVGKRLVDPDD